MKIQNRPLLQYCLTAAMLVVFAGTCYGLFHLAHTAGTWVGSH